MRIITLTTDFGTGSPYVAAMKGVILSINPAATIVDITHAVPAQDIRRGALVLEDTTPWFPDDTIHVAVVDPGVGTARAIVYARIGRQQYIAPDNGLLGRLMARTPPSQVVRLTEPEYWLAEVSHDVPRPRHHGPGGRPAEPGPGPAAARPAAGQLDRCWNGRRPSLSNEKIRGQVIAIDSFGNLITNITSDLLAGRPTDSRVCIVCGIYETFGIYHTYGEQAAGMLVALIGSSGRLELAIVGDNAAARLGVAVGTPVVVAWDVSLPWTPSPTLEQLKHWDRTLVWHAFTQMAEYEPLIIERGEGCTLFDIDGRRYSTASAACGATSMAIAIRGSTRPSARNSTAWPTSRSLGASNPTTILLARRLVDLAPAGPGARLLLRRRGHGRRSGPENGLPVLAAAARSAAGEDLLPGPGRRLPRRHAGRRERRRRRAVPRHVPAAVVRNAPRARARHLSPAAGRAAGEPGCTITWPSWSRCWPQHHGADRRHGDRAAGAGGGRHDRCTRRGYLRGVRELTRQYDVLLIADEVAVGFGRTGRMFACEHEQVTPDLLCLAKGLTGGYLPMAATLATDEIWQAFLGDVRREPDVLSRPHLRRQSAGGGRGAGHAGRLRGGADARPGCRPRSTGSAEHLRADRRGCRTSATSASAG